MRVFRIIIIAFLMCLFALISQANQKPADTVKQGSKPPEIIVKLLPQPKDDKPTASTIISIIALGMSCLTYYFNRSSERTKRKPVLVFECTMAGAWDIKNVGNGPALNIIVVQKKTKKDQNWTGFVRIPALADGNTFNLNWLVSDVPVLGATYTDFQNTPYTTNCEDDKNLIYDGDKIKLPSEDYIKRWWQVTRSQ